MSAVNTTLLSTEAFDALCKKVMRAQRALDSDVHKLAVTAIGYSIIHGDVQPGNRLMDAMQRSLRRDAMVAYLEKHGQFAWLKSDKKFGFFKRDGLTFDAESLLEGPAWYEAKKENEIVSVYDMEAVVDKLVKTVHAKIKSGVEVQNIELFNVITSAVAAYHSARHTRVAEGS